MATAVRTRAGEPAGRALAAPAPAPVRGSSSSDAASGPGTPFVRLAELRSAPPGGASPGIRELLAREGGAPLAIPVRGALQRSLGIDLGTVRLHQGPAASALARAHGARAFAFGSHIVLGAGERGDDLGLIAHEVAHVVQQQGASRVQSYQSAASTDVYEREAQGVARAVVGGQPAAVRERTTPRPQYIIGWIKGKARAAADWVGDKLNALLDMALDFARDKAKLIPGYDMLAFILGRDPITQENVDRSPVNLIKGFMGLWPGGSSFFEALQNHGIIDKVGNWLGTQLNTLKSVVGGLWDAAKTFIKSLGLSDLASPGDVWERAKKIFTVPIDNAKKFVGGLVSDVLGFIRDAILLPIAALASKTPFYNLLKAVLGKDPVTKEPYKASPEVLIGEFMTLIGQQEIWQNMQKARAVPRAFAWFKTTVQELVGFVLQIPTTFINALKSLTIVDMIVVPKAWVKLATAFGTFAIKFASWAGGKIWTLLEIIFDVVSPGALTYIKKTGSAIKSIFKNPMPFMRNLVKAGMLGFSNFADNFGEHLKRGLIDWLTGSMPGVYIPKAFTLGEIVKFAFSVLGISWANIRGKLVKVIGETAMGLLEGAFDVVMILIREGPAAAWEKIKEQIDALKDQVIGGIISMVVEAIAKQAVPKVIAMFIPGAGFISAIITIYDTIMVFVQKISKIIQVVTAFVDSIVNIAAGQIDGAAKKVESVLGNLLSLAISFLAGFAGLGKIADKVMDVIKKVQATVDKGLDALIAWIVTQAKKLFAWIFSKNPADKRTDAEKVADLKKAKADAQALQKKDGISEEGIRAGLPAIQKRYKLTSIALVVDSKDKQTETVHITIVINPEEKTDPTKVYHAGWPPGITDNVKIKTSKTSNRIEKVVKVDEAAQKIRYTQTDKENLPDTIQPREYFVKAFEAGDISLSTAEFTNAELLAQYTKLYGAVVAQGIMKRGDLAKALQSKGRGEAHHIIPIELFKGHALLLELAQTGWNFNLKANGVILAEGFHGNHPEYTAYVAKLVDGWRSNNPTAPISDFAKWVEGTLLKDLKKEIKLAQQSGVSLNAYFAAKL